MRPLQTSETIIGLLHRVYSMTDGVSITHVPLRYMPGAWGDLVPVSPTQCMWIGSVQGRDTPGDVEGLNCCILLTRLSDGTYTDELIPCPVEGGLGRLCGTTACVVGGELYEYIGHSGEMWVLSLDTYEWRQEHPLDHARHSDPEEEPLDLLSFEREGMFHVYWGYPATPEDPVPQTQIEKYDPETRRWIECTPLPTGSTIGENRAYMGGDILRSLAWHLQVWVHLHCVRERERTVTGQRIEGVEIRGIDPGVYAYSLVYSILPLDRHIVCAVRRFAEGVDDLYCYSLVSQEWVSLGRVPAMGQSVGGMAYMGTLGELPAGETERLAETRTLESSGESDGGRSGGIVAAMYGCLEPPSTDTVYSLQLSLPGGEELKPYAQ
ncbi:hypothetical protein KIPB_002523 [Kipferlia bialata]|uniref:Uncharacterized protein n=1 Tax=Kipferlia bialata TaxID=797122 RepID=A0A9K3CSC9_9EUKA|nr:hypothetical protein KIPB_002523 [Kipferlia bialata]|eukprot:g2523.t1